jgi:hypothetical protein
VFVPVCLLLPEGEPAAVGDAQVMRRVLRPVGVGVERGPSGGAHRDLRGGAVTLVWQEIFH